MSGKELQYKGCWYSLVSEVEELRLVPRTGRKGLGVVAQDYNSCSEKVEADEYLGLDGEPFLPSGQPLPV